MPCLGHRCQKHPSTSTSTPGLDAQPSAGTAPEAFPAFFGTSPRYPSVEDRVSVGGPAASPRQLPNPTLTVSSYTRGMEPTSPLEDSRGVDVGQIRELLRMTVAERAAEMVRVCNMVIEVQQRAGVAPAAPVS